MNLNDIMSGKRTGPGSSVLTGKQLDAIARETLALRARVAELEAALESVCVALLPHDSRCQNVNAVFEAHDRARAALKGV